MLINSAMPHTTINKVSDLPAPDKLSAAHSEKVLTTIIAEIKTNGPISYKRFMEITLYEPGLGYYSAGARKFGEAGDFVTAPEISPLFSRCLANQCQQIIKELDNGDILEVGAGSGIMAADILLELEQLNALPQHYYILEISADLKQRQQNYLQQHIPHLLDRIVWLETLPKQSIKAVILANEVLDAMPVHLFKTQNGIKECYVTLTDGQLNWLLKAPSEALRNEIEKLGMDFPNNYQSELNLALQPWLYSMSKILRKGAVLIIDYGFPRHEYYHPQRSCGTLMCHYRHRSHSNPLVLPGIQDITAHVDFTAVAEAADAAGLAVTGYATQANFLLSCGITNSVAPNLDATEQWKVSQQIKKLLLPSEMGELFKTMALTKNLSLDLIGFQMSNIKNKL